MKKVLSIILAIIMVFSVIGGEVPYIFAESGSSTREGGLTLEEALAALEEAQQKKAQTEAALNDAAEELEDALRQEASGSVGLFEYYGSTHAASVIQTRIDSQESDEVWGHTNLGEKGDATSLDNMRRAITWIESGNELRTGDDNFPGAGDLYITDSMMAAAQVQTNASSENLAHSRLASSNIGENLAWSSNSSSAVPTGYNPYNGWYGTEKAVYNWGIAQGLGTDASSWTDSQKTACKEALNLSDIGFVQTGHYLNLVKTSWKTTGFACNDNGTIFKDMGYAGYYTFTFGQTFSYGSDSGFDAGDTRYTPSDYIERFDQYLDALQTRLSNAQIDYNTAVDEDEYARQALYNAQQTYQALLGTNKPDDYEFHAYVAGTETDSTHFDVEYGTSVTLEVDVVATEMDGITYRWIDQDLDSGAWITIEGETGSSYTTPALTSRRTFICEVTDKYGEHIALWFVIGIENDLEAYAVDSGEQTAAFYVEPGSALTLEVYANTGSGAIHYEWFDENGTISGEYGTSYYISSVDDAHHYQCYITDDYGHYITIDFYVRIVNNLVAYVKGTENESTTFDVAPETPFILEVEASANNTDGITYTWYDATGSNWVELEGDGPSYAVSGITSRTAYVCEVEDKYGNYATVWFTVRIENTFYAYIEGTEEETTAYYKVTPGESLTLSVMAYTASGELHYEWFKRGDIIPGETGSSYTIQSVDEGGYYQCSVTDDFNHCFWLIFYISIDNHLVAYAKGTTDDYKEYEVASGSVLTLEVEASATNMDGLTYKWVDQTDGWDVIEGETGPSYTTPALTSRKVFRCEAIDKYGNEAPVWFIIDISDIENEFYAYVAGTTDTSVIYNVPPKSTLTLSVDAGVSSGEIHYTWVKYDLNSNSSAAPVTIEGADGPDLIVENITEAAEYRCHVTDEYDNYENIWFDIYIDNDFSINPKGALPGSSLMICVDKGETATLEVDTFGNDLEGVNYRWVDVNNNCTIEGADGPVYTTPAINDLCEYVCYATDKYGNSSDAYFMVCINNGLTAYVEGRPGVTNTTIYAAPGEDVIMMVEAYANEGDLTYRWFYNYGGQIEGADGPSYNAESVTENATYTCNIIDMYGSVEGVTFNVIINNDLRASANGPSDIAVLYGESAVLEVAASCINGDISYQWYRVIGNSSEFISEAASSILTLENITQSATYFCAASDMYGSSINVWFNVSIDDGFYAVARDGRTSFSVLQGSDVTMAVRAGDLAMSTLTYEWRDLNGNILEGSGGPEYTIKNITTDKAGTYFCHIRNGNGSFSNIQFYVNVYRESLLCEPTTSIYFNVEKGTDVEMGMAVTEGLEGVTYQWQKYNSQIGNYEDIPGATSPSYTVVNASATGYYRCVATKGEKEGIISYTVRVFEIDDDAMANAETLVLYEKTTVRYRNGAIVWFKYTPDETKQYYFTSDRGSTECDPVVDLYKMENGKLSFITTADDYDSLDFVLDRTLEAGVTYYFGVRQYSNGMNCDIYVCLSTELTTITARPNDGNNNIYVAPGASAILEVEVDNPAGIPVSYNWYNSEYSGQVLSQEASYTTESITQYTYYYCDIYDLTDDTGRFLRVGFYVYPSSDLSLRAKNDMNEIHIQSGGEAVLEVVGASSYGEIAYNWYYADSSKPIAHGDSKKITVSGLKETRIFRCTAYDGYNEASVYITVFVDGTNNGLPVDQEHFPDQELRNMIRSNYDGDKDGYLSDYERGNVQYLNISNTDVSDFKGLEYFPNLKVLYASNIGEGVTELDLSGFENLFRANVSYNGLTELNIDGLDLSYLDCHGNNIMILDISGCPMLIEAYLSGDFEDHGDYVEYYIYDYGYSLIVDKTTTITGAMPTVFATYNGATLSLKDKISVNVYFKIPEEADGWKAIVLYEKDDYQEIKASYDLNKSSKAYVKKSDEYKIAYSDISAKEMTEHVAIIIVDKDGNPIRIQEGGRYVQYILYCAADWANTMINDPARPAKTVKLAKALLNYGGEAQKYFDYKLELNANADGHLATEMAAVTVNNLKPYAPVKDANASAVGENGISLSLKSETYLNVYFKKEVTVTAANLNGANIAVNKSGKEWVAKITGITAKNLGTQYTLTIKNGSTTSTQKYCALSWAYNVLDKGTSAKAIPLAKALYLYQQAAVEYFN